LFGRYNSIEINQEQHVIATYACTKREQ